MATSGSPNPPHTFPAFFLPTLPLADTTSLPEAVQYVCENSRAQIVVVEDNAQLQKVLSVRERLPLLKAIVQYTGTVSDELKAQGVYDWAGFMAIGEEVADHELQWRVDEQKPENCCMCRPASTHTTPLFTIPPGNIVDHFHARQLTCRYGDLIIRRDSPMTTSTPSHNSLSAPLPFPTILPRPTPGTHTGTLIFTSGTTGNPKAVMISHDNITWTASSIADMLRLKAGREAGVSYLPLSHIAAQMLDIIAPMSHGGCVWFARPDALKGTLFATLKEVRPTYVTRPAACATAGAPAAITPSTSGPCFWCYMLLPCRHYCWLYLPFFCISLFSSASSIWLLYCYATPSFAPRRYFLGVPRVWEKLQEAMMALGAKTKGAKKKIATWAKEKGALGNHNIQEGKSVPFGFGLANVLVFKKIRKALGLDRCTLVLNPPPKNKNKKNKQANKQTTTTQNPSALISPE